MYGEVKALMLKKFTKIYLILCLCGDQERLQTATKAQEIADENEILREDFMKSKLYFR